MRIPPNKKIRQCIKCERGFLVPTESRREVRKIACFAGTNREFRQYLKNLRRGKFDNHKN